MSLDYITSVTEEDAFHVFCNMSNDLLAVEIMGMKDALNMLAGLDAEMLDSFAFDYVANILDIAKEALVHRFICSHVPFNSDNIEKDIGCSG